MTEKDQLPGLREDSQKRSQNEKLIGEQVMRLLSHYWAGNENELLRREQAKDWLADLAEFPAAIVADACAAWRRTEERRPGIAAIRKLCLERLPQKSDVPKLPHRPQEYREYESERNRLWAEAHDAHQRWAEEHGFQNFAEVMQYGIQAAGRRVK